MWNTNSRQAYGQFIQANCGNANIYAKSLWNDVENNRNNVAWFSLLVATVNNLLALGWKGDIANLGKDERVYMKQC